VNPERTWFRPLLMGLLAVAIGAAGCGGSTSEAPLITAGSPTPNPSVSSVSAASAGATASTTPADLPAGRVLFHRTGPDEVERYFTIRTDGTDETAVFERQGCSCAHLSADGRRIRTIGETGHGTWSLLTMNLDGSDQVMTDPPIATLNLFTGAASADGRVLALEGVDESIPANTGLWVTSPTVTEARQVTPLHEGWRGAAPLGVTPDASKIVFFVDTGPHGGATHAGDLYVINSDGSGLMQLNPSGSKLEDVGMPVASLSRDGTQAAFGVDDSVWVVDLEGGDARAVTARTGYAWAVQWSPTGEWLTYTRFHGHTTAVALVRPDGSDDHEITPLVETDEANAAVWSPDGKYLLVPRDSDASIDGPRDLWILGLEGRWIGQVTHEPSNYATYSWAPASDS
jgi:Tol biopolymer transport system component